MRSSILGAVARSEANKLVGRTTNSPVQTISKVEPERTCLCGKAWMASEGW